MTRDPVLATIVACGQARIRLNIEVSRHKLISTLIYGIYWIASTAASEWTCARPPAPQMAWVHQIHAVGGVGGFATMVMVYGRWFMLFVWFWLVTTNWWNSGSLGGWVNHSVSVLWWLRLSTHQKWLPHHCKTHVRCFITFICCGCAYWSAVSRYPCPMWNCSWKFLYSASLLGGGQTTVCCSGGWG